MITAKVYWVAKYTQVWNNGVHSHSFCQVLFMLGGKGIVQVDGVEYKVNKGDVFIIAPNVEHCITNDPESKDKLKALDVKFSIQDPEVMNDFLKLQHYYHIDDFEYFQLKIEHLINEVQNQQKYCNDVVDMSFSVLLIKLIRCCSNVPINTEISYTHLQKDHQFIKGVDVEELMDFINQNFGKIISLNDLSKFANVNKTTLIYIFKELFATTPIKYINEIRMKKAKLLLTDTDMNVSEISELVGFQSIHYFSRNFKEKEGLSPLQYRLNHKGSSFITISESKENKV